MKTLFFIVSFFCISCSVQEKDIVKIHLVPENAQLLDLNMISDSIRSVVLDTNDTCLITNVRDMILYDHNIYIYDMESSKVFIFDDQGKLLSVINDKGNGPNEYISLSCFYIDKELNVLVLVDNQKKKEHLYDLIGTYISNRAINFKVKSVAFFGDKQKLIIQEQVDAVNNSGFLLNIYRENSIEDQYLKFHYESGVTITSKDHSETAWVSGFYYNSLNNDTIYGYSNGDFSPHFLIDFGLNGIPEKIKNKPLNERSKAVYKYLKGQDYKVASWLSVLSREKDHMLLSYSYNKIPYFGLYDLNKEILIKEFCNPLLGNLPISEIMNSYFFSDNSLCFVVDGYSMSNCKKEKLDELEFYNADLCNKIKEINFDSNPVIIIAHNILDNRY